MGGGGSQSSSQFFDMKAINKSVFEQITKNQARASATQASVQNLRITFRDLSGCTIKGKQTIDASAVSSSKLTSDTTTEIKNAITNEMQASVSAQMEKITELGNMQFGDKQVSEQDLKQEIQNIIENSITTENINEAIVEQVNIQGEDLVFRDCLDSDIDLTQDIVAVVAADVITSAVSEAIASSEMLNQLDAAASTKLKTENKGLADLVKKFFEGLTGPLKYGIIAAVVCCFLLVLVVIVIGLSPAGQSATKNIGKAGASRMKRF